MTSTTRAGAGVPMRTTGSPRLVTAEEVRRALPVALCIDALHAAWRAGAQRTTTSFVAGAASAGGKFHVKAALALEPRPLFAAKVNANFPGNPAERGLPTIQGIVALFDAADGRLLAMLDSPSLTAIRTAAATGVAARYLADPRASTVAIIGCGAQALDQLAAVCAVRPIRRAILFDTDASRSRALHSEASSAKFASGIELEVADQLAAATLAAEIVVTLTPARAPFLDRDHVRPGTFIAAVGADSPDKSEIHPALLAHARVVVDDLEQCAAMGDLHHALDAGAMTRDAVVGTIADLVAEPELFAWSADRLAVFDSTGIPLEDVVAAKLAYERLLSS